MEKVSRFLLLYSFLSTFLCSFSRPQLSPYQYGLREARTGIERYWALYKAHYAAINLGLEVSYIDIDSLEIEIPLEAKSIPIGEQTNFGGLVLNVINNSKDIFLFSLSQEAVEISVSKRNIDEGNFKSISPLNEGRNLLIITDKNPWVKNRKGHSYGHIRKDLLLIKDGLSENKPISPYNNDATSVSASYCTVTKSQKLFSELKVIRSQNSTKKTFLLNIKNQYNVLVKNVEIKTPARLDSMVDDRLFRITNSALITFKNVRIDGTYSRKDRSGYGISMDNVYDSNFEKLFGQGNWGIFGNNNINNAEIISSDINRFDIHCYGRDVRFERCLLRDKGLPLSSFFGKVVFDNCNFIDCIPIIFRDDYNAYTKFDLIIKSCKFYSSKRTRCFIIKANGFGKNDENKRSELSESCLPNVNVKGLKIYSKGDLFGKFYLFYFGLKKINVDSELQIDEIEFLPNNKSNVSFSVQGETAFLGSKFGNNTGYIFP